MLKHLIDCIGFPIFLAGLLTVRRPLKKNILFLLAIVFLLLFINSLLEKYISYSSRYYSLFIPLFIFLSVVNYKNTSAYSLILLLLVLIQMIMVFSSDENKYIYYLNEIAKDINTRKKLLLIQQNEYPRLSNSLNPSCIRESAFYDLFTINEAIKQYTFYSEPCYFLGGIKTMDFLNIKSNNLITVNAIIRSKNKKKTFFLLSKKSQETNNTNLFYDIKRGEMIPNGDIEDVLPVTAKKDILNWIYQGASFYNDSSLLIPKSSSLIPTWKTINCLYPKVYADSESPIEGKYSLHLILSGSNDPVFLLNGIKSKPGVLSLSIQNLADESSFMIQKYDYDSSYKLVNIYPIYHFILSDKDIHQISIEYKLNDFYGPNTVFAVTGNSSNILIDNLSYVYLEESYIQDNQE